MQVQVISLARSHERRRAFQAHNPHLRFVFRDAVDGSALAPADLLATGLFEPGLDYTPGAYGAALSHHRLWQEAIARGEPVTVAEDDAIFRGDFHEKQARLLAELPPDWDFVLWGWNFDAMLLLNLMPAVSPLMLFASQDGLRGSVDAFQRGRLLPALLPLDRCFGTPAYTLSAKGARRFTGLCFPLAPFQLMFPLMPAPIPNTGIDLAMNRIYARTASYVSLPPLVATPNDSGTSTVQTGQPLRLA